MMSILAVLMVLSLSSSSRCIIDPAEAKDFPDVSNHRNLLLLPENCGPYYPPNKMLHGYEAELFEFPWMALLSYQIGNGLEFKCTGTIINMNYILTAAHCIEDKLTKVRVGDHNIDTEEDCISVIQGKQKYCAPPYQDLKVEYIIIHPNYNSITKANDIALLRVTPMNTSQNNIRPICLPVGESRYFDFTDDQAIVTGWGVTETGSRSSELCKMTLPVVALEECHKLYSSNPLISVDERQLCAGGKDKKDFCDGDSGGPLQVVEIINGTLRVIQQGIVSFGAGCGANADPFVYTRIAAFMDWILDNMSS